MDRTAPGLIDAFYLVGPVALGDYQSGMSDIDFLAVTSRPLDDADLTAVAGVHQRMPATPYYDGVYLDRARSAAAPDDSPAVPHVVGGEFRAKRACGELNPVLWLTLAQCGVVVRGRPIEELGVRVEPRRLRQWNLDNLRDYWQPLAGRIRWVAESGGAQAVSSAGVVWAVLGPARLHYTLATGAVVSKTEAGRYAARQFPAWADLAARAVSCRGGQRVDFLIEDALAAAAMVDAVVDDAWRCWG
jgi:hypothetical protein